MNKVEYRRVCRFLLHFTAQTLWKNYVFNIIYIIERKNDYIYIYIYEQSVTKGVCKTSNFFSNLLYSIYIYKKIN